MAKRYRRDKQKQQIKGQTLQWPQDTDEINRSYTVHSTSHQSVTDVQEEIVNIQYTRHHTKQ